MEKCSEEFGQSMDLGNLRLLRDYLLDNMPSSYIVFHVQSLMKNLEESEPIEVNPKGEDSCMKISVSEKDLVLGPSGREFQRSVYD
jgi:hypothetical protein